MKQTRYTTEQIIMNLRKVEVMVGQGKTIQESCRDIGVNEQTYYRWRNKYGGMSTNDAKRLKALEKENERLKRIVADLSVDNAVLKEAFAEKERIIEEARKKAVSEAHLQIEEATRRIREEKEKAIREVRSEIADLSIAIAEKVMKEKIGRDKEQQQMIDRLLDEVSFSKS